MNGFPCCLSYLLRATILATVVSGIPSHAVHSQRREQPRQKQVDDRVHKAAHERWALRELMYRVAPTGSSLLAKQRCQR